MFSILVRTFSIIFLLHINETYAAVKITTFPQIAVDKSSINLFSTPLAYYQGAIYTVNVEPAISDLNIGLNLRTIVRKAVLMDGSKWNWESQIIDQNTIADKYHTQASIGVDKQGYLHIAYGMHNMPWQYVVSNSPGDISSFSFMGTPVTTAEKVTVKIFNKTPFPAKGTAAIPGNQITYPAFFYDRNTDLYVSYRFAVKPKRSFKDRGFSAAIARYDINSKKWRAFGGSVLNSRQDAEWPGKSKTSEETVFAYQRNWTVYPPRLAFDKNNGMHVAWLWRKGSAGGDTSHPSYAFSPYNKELFYTAHHTEYSMPVSESSASWIDKPTDKKFTAIPDLTVDDNHVYVVLQKWGGAREFYQLNRLSGKWTHQEPLPYAASTLKIDQVGGQWAFATGLRVLHRRTGHDKWRVVFEEKGKRKFGYPKVLQVFGENKFFIHMQSLNGQWVKIYQLEF